MRGTSGEGSVPLQVLAARFAWCVDIRDTSGVALVKPFHSRATRAKSPGDVLLVLVVLSCVLGVAAGTAG